MTDPTPDVCRCGRPTRDQAFFCDTCGDELTRALGDVAWLETELETSVTRSRGVDYRTRGGTPSSETASPVSWSAADARRDLTGFLIAWVRYCHEHEIRHQSPRSGMPSGDRPTLTALSRWLLWRVDGLSFDQSGPAAVQQIISAVKRCRGAVFGPPEKMYAGKCSAEIEDVVCENELYVKLGAKVVRCGICGTEWDVPQRREWLLAEAEEVLANAVAISRAVSWLGTEPLNAATVRQWASRKRLLVRGHDRDGKALYRVGDAIDLLSRTGKASA